MEDVSFPEVFPASYFCEELISRAGGVLHHLSVALDGEVGNQSSSVYRTSDETVAQKVHGMLRGQGGSVVTDDRHTVADGIVSPCV